MPNIAAKPHKMLKNASTAQKTLKKAKKCSKKGKIRKNAKNAKKCNCQQNPHLNNNSQTCFCAVNGDPP